jgi:hypothetical protein
MSLITCNRLVEHDFAMLMSLTYSSVSGANLRMSIAPIMPDNGVLCANYESVNKQLSKCHCAPISSDSEIAKIDCLHRKYYN